MKGLLRNWQKETYKNEGSEIYEWKRQIDALYGLLTEFFGADKLVLKATRLEALSLMRSSNLNERIAGLQKIVFEDPTDKEIPKTKEIPEILKKIEEQIADLFARRTVEERLEKAVADKMDKKHEEYVKDIRTQVLKENAGPENAQTLKKLASLEKMNQVKLANFAADVLRPKNVNEIIGQESALQALITKLATPYPQHIIIYGPPGVGKTSAARVALEMVKNYSDSPFAANTPFIEVDGTTLRWDPRDVTNPLLGSVHDPIYQGAKRDLADTGIPEPKLGLVSDAHGGILFIDEIGEMDSLLLNKLLKVLEDKRVNFDSSYYDPADSQIPLYIKKIFDEGAPADFVLIGATTRDPSELNPALRSRCAEVYFEPLEPNDIQAIVRLAAQKLAVEIEDNVPEIISEYVIEGRKASHILMDAYGLARFRSQKIQVENNCLEQSKLKIESSDVYEVLRAGRLTPFAAHKASSSKETGRILGLGVAGFLGSVLEIEVNTFSVKDGKGSVRFNETAGSMARDAVFNAATVIRKVTGEDLRDYDLHVNIIGGGKIDGPSAGLATTLAIYSSIKGLPLSQEVAVTGEISIQGKVRPVGGIYEKIFGAKQAGVKTVLIPVDNSKDIPRGLRGINVVPVNTFEEAMKYVF